MIKNIMTKVKTILDRSIIAFKLLSKGKAIIVFENLLTRFYSDKVSIGFQRISTKEFNSPKSKINVSIRLFEKSDFGTLNESYRHKRLINENIKHCYSAIDNEDNVCYRQWLIGFKENDKIQNYFGELFPRLNNGEALVEGVFTNPDYRGFGIMAFAMSEIAELGFRIGYKKIIVFVDRENIPSLKGCIRSGFEPYIIMRKKWRFGIRKVIFEELSNEIIEHINTFSENNPIED